MSEYAKEYYNVPADIGRLVTYNGRGGIIYEDRGNYINAIWNGVIASILLLIFVIGTQNKNGTNEPSKPE